MADNKTPNVNFMLDFLLPHYEDQAKQDQRNYYSSNKYNDYVKYVETGIKDLKNLDYVEYANNDTKSSGIFNENGKLDRTEISSLRKDLRETQSVIWSAVISFEEKFGKKWCSNYEQAQNILQKELPKFFKNAGLKPENMEWFAGLHENTDNRHIHLIFFEKKPLRNVKGKKAFSIGKLPLNAMDRFKAEIELCATDYKAREIKIRTQLKKSMREEQNEISNIKLKEMLLEIANELPENSPNFYNSAGMEKLHSKIDYISNYIINHDKNILSYKLDFDDIVKEKDEMIKNYCRRNDCKYPTESVGDKMMRDLYRRLGNIIIEKAKDVKFAEIERLKLDARYKYQKQMQRKKLLKLFDECIYLSMKYSYEAIKAFQDFMRKLEEIHIKQLIEEGVLDAEDFQISM